MIAGIIEMHNPPYKDWDAVASDLGIDADKMADLRVKLETLRP